MPKQSILSLVVAFVVAVLVTGASDRRSFEEKTERVTVAEQANAPGTKCPLSRQYIDEADLGLLRVCLTYGLSAYEAARRYPDSAAKVFAVYGEDETFRKVLDQYGQQVIPVVAYFVENGSFEFQIRQTLGEILEQLWAGKRPRWEPAKLTREQIGLIAIYEIAARGNEILAEFEIVDGIATPKPVTGIILEAKQFLLEGVGDFEKVLVRGERLPTWKEAGLAALDAAVVVGGVGAFAKVARVGRYALVEKSTGRLMVEGAYETVSAVGKTGALIAPYAALYVVVTRPTLIPSLGGWVAEQFGINRIVGIFAVYFLAILLALKLLRPPIWCGKIVSWSFRRLRHLFAYRPRRCLHSQSMIRAG
jgi:hypothetical protein